MKVFVYGFGELFFILKNKDDKKNIEYIWFL